MTVYAQGVATKLSKIKKERERENKENINLNELDNRRIKVASVMSCCLVSLRNRDQYLSSTDLDVVANYYSLLGWVWLK